MTARHHNPRQPFTDHDSSDVIDEAAAALSAERADKWAGDITVETHMLASLRLPAPPTRRPSPLHRHRGTRNRMQLASHRRGPRPDNQARPPPLQHRSPESNSSTRR